MPSSVMMRSNSLASATWQNEFWPILLEVSASTRRRPDNIMARFTSAYENENYLAAAEAFAPITKEIMLAVNPTQPGVNPQPWVGIQYVTVPEFQDLGNQVLIRTVAEPGHDTALAAPSFSVRRPAKTL